MVLVGRKQYMRLTGKGRRFVEAYEKLAGEFDLASLDLDPDELFTAARDKTRGPRGRLVTLRYLLDTNVVI